MKSYQECISLCDQRTKSELELYDERNRLTKILEMLDTRVGDNRKSAALGSIAVSVLWILIYLAIFVAASSVPWRGLYMMRPITAVSCLLMGIVMLVSEFMDLKYINSIMAYTDQVQQMIKNLELSTASLIEKERFFYDSAREYYDYPLLRKKDQSVITMGINIRETVASMEKFSSSFLETVKNALYYVTMVCITAVCAIALQERVYHVVFSICEFEPSEGVYLALVLAVVVAQIIIGRRFWAMTNCTVTNVTLLMTASGPVFIGLTIFGLIVIGGIVTIVISLAVIALAIGIGCGISSGG